MGLITVPGDGMKQADRFQHLKRLKIYPALKAYEQFMENSWYVNQPWPAFDEKHKYFMAERGNDWHGIVSDHWDGFLAGWEERGRYESQNRRGHE